MNDTNVSEGMVPCRKNCRCSDCQIERLRTENDRLRREINYIGGLASQGVSAEIIRQRAADALQTKGKDEPQLVGAMKSMNRTELEEMYPLPEKTSP